MAKPKAKMPKIVCISGSTRFLDEMAVAAWEMEKQGILVVGPHLLPQNYPGVQPSHQAEAEGVRAVLDELHLRKIDLCDEVYVVNVNGYIGESTRNELEYARAVGKPIRYMTGGTMNHLPTQDEFKEKVGKLQELLSDPHPGLMTWCEARYRLMSELHEMLGKVLDVMNR